MRIISKSELVPADQFSLVGEYGAALVEIGLANRFKVQATEEGAEQFFVDEDGNQFIVEQKDAGLDVVTVSATAPSSSPSTQEFLSRLTLAA